MGGSLGTMMVSEGRAAIRVVPSELYPFLPWRILVTIKARSALKLSLQICFSSHLSINKSNRYYLLNFDLSK